MDDLSNQPGFLGLTIPGSIAIHADWPAYPITPGWEIALVTLGSFPRGTAFRAADDIDQALLLSVDLSGTDACSSKRSVFHVALWHEDILALADKGCASGAAKISGREADRRKQERIEDAIRAAGGTGNDTLYILYNEKYVPVRTLPQGDDEADSACVPEINADGLRVTQRGFECLQQLMQDELPHLTHVLPRQVGVLLDAGLHDTAVREACLAVEGRLRELTAMWTLFGNKLVEAFVEQLHQSDHYISAHVKCLAGELKCFFKFVRNEYMHNFKEVDRADCCAVLGRIGLLLDWLRAFDTETLEEGPGSGRD